MRKIFYAFIACIFIWGLLPAQPGTLDPSFGTDGVFLYSCGNVSAIYDLTVLDDNSIIGVGECRESSFQDFFALKLDQDGNLDESFADGGILHTSVSQINDYLSAVASQQDGSTIIAGQAWNEDAQEQQLTTAKLNQSGEVDETFGSDGFIFEYGLADYFKVSSVVMQPDGKVLVMGTAKDSMYDSFGWGIFIIRYNSDGTRDGTFGSAGIYNFTGSSKQFESKFLQLQDDGKILLVYNYAEENGGNHITVGRLNENGTADESFGNNGFMSYGVGEKWYAGDIGLADNGDIFVGGYAYNDGDFDQLIFKCHGADGSLNTDYGNSGITIQDIGGKSNQVYQLLVFGNEAVSVGINATSDKSYDYSSDFLSVRYTANGEMDETFGENGAAITDISTVDVATAAGIQDDGKIIVGGGTDFDGIYQVAIVRYLNDAETNIEESDIDKPEIILFPNPVEEVLHLDYKKEIAVDQVLITNLYGQQIYKGSIKHEFEIAYYRAGIYMINVIGENGNILTSEKFVKN